MEGKQEGREVTALHSSRTHLFDIIFLDLLRSTDLKASQNVCVWEEINFWSSLRKEATLGDHVIAQW